jgi:hypothetical protein
MGHVRKKKTRELKQRKYRPSKSKQKTRNPSMPATPEQPTQPAQPAPTPAPTEDQQDEEKPEQPSPKRQKHAAAPNAEDIQTHLDAIRVASDDILVAIDAIWNAETTPDLADIEAVVAANKNIQLHLDAINPPLVPRVQHKYAAQLFDEAMTAAKRKQHPPPAGVRRGGPGGWTLSEAPRKKDEHGKPIGAAVYSPVYVAL